MINYKQLISDLKNIAIHHEQINSFGFGDLSQITNDIETKQEPKYTRMYIVPGDVEFNQYHIHYKFGLIIMDRVDDDLSNLNDDLIGFQWGEHPYCGKLQCLPSTAADPLDDLT